MTAREVAWLFRALGDGTRLRSLALLLRGEMSFADLRRILRRPPSTLSRHMRYLHARGLIQWRRTSNTVMYRIHPNPGPVQRRTLSLVRASERLIDEAPGDRAHLRRKPAQRRRPKSSQA